MARTTPTQQSFTGGELSPALFGRFDLAVYGNGASWLQNFIATTQGTARFRSGSKFVWNTRDNAVSRIIKFEYNTTQAYVLSFTDQCLRIIKDGGLVTIAPQAVTAITNANPAVVTYVGADPTNGQRIVLAGMAGMTEVNNQEYIVANVNAGANTLELQGVNSAGFGAFTAGGTMAVVVEVVTPYIVGELFELEYASTNDTMYITHPSHAPQKLTRTSHTSWTLTPVTFLCNPFGTTKAASQALSAATKANPCVVTYVGADTYANGDTVFIDTVVGMTQLNGRNFTVANVNAGANTFELQGVDSTLYTAYTSGGTVAEYSAFSYPALVAFFEQRLLYAASDSFPQRLWGSVGASYDDFDTGTGQADEAFIYTVASGTANRIRWMVPTEDFLALGTAGGEFKADGGTNGDAVTPTNITIKPPSYYGSAQVKPVRLDSHILYIQRDGLTARTFEFDAIQSGFVSLNRTLTADQILQGRSGYANGVKDIANQPGNPNINWMVKNDGALAGLTFEPREQVNGWHRHYAGGYYASGANFRPEYGSIAAIPNSGFADQLYTVVTRTIDAATVRYIEYFADQPVIPRMEDYYTGDDGEVTDKAAFLQDMWEAQKRLFYVDSGLVYDGTVAQTMTLTSAAVGAGVTATAGGATFAATDVGREIWGKKGGKAVITAYTSATVVTVQVTIAFPALAIAASGWYLTSNSFTGFEHLENEDIMALADGAVLQGIQVLNGGFTTAQQHSYLVAGLKYVGLVRGLDIIAQGDNGAGAAKNKSISKVGTRFLDTMGARMGTDLYKLETVKFRDMEDILGRPPPLFSGIKMVDIKESWDLEKHVYCVQDLPVPCNVQMFVPNITVNDA